MKQKQGKCKSMSSNQNKLNRKYIFSIYKFLGEQGRIADSYWSIESCRSIDRWDCFVNNIFNNFIQYSSLFVH